MGGLMTLVLLVAAHCQLQAAMRLAAHVFQLLTASAAVSVFQTHASMMARLTLLARPGHQLTTSAQHALARSTHSLARSSPSAQLPTVQPSTRNAQLTSLSTLRMVVAESADQLVLLSRMVAQSRPTTLTMLRLMAVSQTILLR